MNQGAILIMNSPLFQTLLLVWCLRTFHAILYNAVSVKLGQRGAHHFESVEC